jgi:FlaA1/EpsC-like NDP-sugar epimerase
VDFRLKKMDWSGFLGRPGLAQPAAPLDALRHQPVLVTGAGGSIGSALALRLASLEPSPLILLESSESNLFALQGELAEAGLAAETAFRLGSVADRALLEEIFSLYAPRLVFHAAGFKHVPLLEEQPLAAIENNIFGTLSLVRAMREARIVLLSTDKAASPVSMMGAAKRVAERIVLDAGGVALRLGNVLASRGSVAEIFARQIAAGGPMTVTSPSARRYFLTIEEAVGLLLSAAGEPEPHGLLVPALCVPHPVVDLARFMAQQLAPGRAIPVEFTGLRPGDKESEQFWSATDSVQPASSPNLLRVEVQPDSSRELARSLTELRGAVDARDLHAALAQMRRLAPDYEPGRALLALAGERKPCAVL